MNSRNDRADPEPLSAQVIDIPLVLDRRPEDTLQTAVIAFFFV
jgi:hypothetical protein